ncbi:hypothetical protein HDV00_006008 [Rhizophlyctis rosea]|nr:hypothetical protein HDV00_006008 [Rhizophlyctis rosea]
MVSKDLHHIYAAFESLYPDACAAELNRLTTHALIHQQSTTSSPDLNALRNARSTSNTTLTRDNHPRPDPNGNIAKDDQGHIIITNKYFLIYTSFQKLYPHEIISTLQKLTEAAFASREAGLSLCEEEYFNAYKKIRDGNLDEPIWVLRALTEDALKMDCVRREEEKKLGGGRTESVETAVVASCEFGGRKRRSWLKLLKGKSSGFLGGVKG